MLQVFHFGPMLGLPDVSPFCLKVLLYLKMAEMEFRSVVGVQNLRKAPRGKLPFISVDGLKIADSSLVVRHLESVSEHPLDVWVPKTERPRMTLVQRLLEDHFYWVLLYSRWADDDYWPRVSEAFFAKLPAAARPLIRHFARKQTLRQLWSQGLSRHDKDEIYAQGCADLDALTAMIRGPFMLGDQISTLDATTGAFVAQVLVPDLDTPLKRHAKTLPSLVDYGNRVRAFWET